MEKLLLDIATWVIHQVCQNFWAFLMGYSLAIVNMAIILRKVDHKRENEQDEDTTRKN